MSLRAMDLRCCAVHGECLHHFSQCCRCGVQIPTQLEDNTTREARTRKQRSRDRARMAKARSAKEALRASA